MLLVDFHPPRIYALTLSSKDMFNKRPHYDKSTKTETSKASQKVNSLGSPTPKRVKMNSPLLDPTSKDDANMPPSAHRYSTSLKPTSFVHVLEEALLPQMYDGYREKILDQIIIEAADNSFHVCFLSLFCLLFVPFYSYYQYKTIFQRVLAVEAAMLDRMTY